MRGGPNPNITYIVENKWGQELAGNKLKLKWVQKDEIESKMGREWGREIMDFETG